jgi:hypothetical protein
MKILLALGLLSSLASAEYFKVDYPKDNPATGKCLRVEIGTTEEAVQKTKSISNLCRDRETLIKDTFSVLCKDPKVKPPSQIFFFSKNEKSCLALLEFQNTGKVPEEFRKSAATH